MTETPTCPHGCGGAVYVKDADEMPTLVGPEGESKTTFQVRYCSNGHVLGYRDRTRPLGEDAPVRRGDGE